MRKTIHSASTERMVFLLVQALPQALVNVFFQTAAARFSRIAFVKQVSNHTGCRQLGGTFSHANGTKAHAFRGAKKRLIARLPGFIDIHPKAKIIRTLLLLR